MIPRDVCSVVNTTRRIDLGRARDKLALEDRHHTRRTHADVEPGPVAGAGRGAGFLAWTPPIEALASTSGWAFSSPSPGCSARTNVAEVISELPRPFKPCRYPKMRPQVRLLLAQVRRLHWTAVDGRRGFKNSKEAVAEMDAIEQRMMDIVTRIRREAVVVSDELDPVPAPDETSQSDE